MNYREYGKLPYKVLVVHGGPGAPGCCAGICRGLADEFGVLEYLQCKNSIQELIEELHSIVIQYNLSKIVLAGHSWGAWLSFIFAAKHPQYVSKLILIDSGPFEAKYLPLLHKSRNRQNIPLEQLKDIKKANLYSKGFEYNPDNYCLLPDIESDMINFNKSQYELLMNEIRPMRANGELLNFSNLIECPVVAIHGKNDPHPWEGVKIPLESRLTNFKMFIIDKCGHDPWKEYYARDEFFSILKREIIKIK